ncbi:MAG: hypothetical protein ACL7BU_15880 [Candidatus Phlomobacter fragariae]
MFDRHDNPLTHRRENMNNQFTTQAGNFVSISETGVDPRIGQFRVNFR